MGKKSLIKSTSKKKSETSEVKEKTTQKAATKTAKKSTAKSTPKKSGQSASKTKKDSKAASKSKPAAKKSRSIKELTFLKFEPFSAPAEKQAPPKPTSNAPTAPPLINVTDAKEAERLHLLLARKFDMAEIKAAAKEPVPKPAPADIPAPEAKPAEEAPADIPAPEAKPAEEAPAPSLVVESAAKSTAQPAAEPAPKPVEESAYITFEPTESEKRSEPVSRPVKIAIAAAALLILILLAVSANNSGKYYIKPIDNAIEIWKGDFSPKDKEFFMVLHGVTAPEQAKGVYSKSEVFPLIFNYYIDKADTLLEVNGLPDFEGIKKYLHQAEDYAVTNEMTSVVNDRLHALERMTLLYKADVAISRNTEESLDAAIKLLKDAAKLAPSTLQAEEINQKIETAREKINMLKAGPAAEQPSEK